MSIGLVGRKCGMTRIFTKDGSSISISVVEVLPNVITQIKTKKIDGYCAIQVTTGQNKVSRLNKSLVGHYSKAKVVAGRGLWEFRLDDNSETTFNVGEKLTINKFKVGQMVNITGISKGKGFSGVIKKYHFKSQDATHGNSLAHNAPGSIGQNQTPGKVFKGKKMAGQLGNFKVTAKNLEIIRVDIEQNALLIKGSIPGSPSGNIIINFRKT